MRLLVFFDLPVMSAEDRRNYTRFRNFLLRDGFDMLQFSVYCRVCNGLDAVEKHATRLNRNLPPKGSIRMLSITDKQYGRMKHLIGKPTTRERKVSSEQLILL